MTTSRLIVLGNSHSEALPRDPLDGFDLTIHWLMVKNASRFGTLTMPEAAALAASLTERDALILMHLGSLHNIIGLLNHETPYAFLQEQGKSTGVEGAQIIPVSTLQATFAAVIARDAVVAAMKTATRARVFHIMPPPPKQAITRDYSSKVYHGNSVAELGFSPPAHRLGLWRLEDALVSDYVEKLGITHVTPPENTLTAEGYLAPIFCADDATHANRAYGKALMDHLVVKIRQNQSAMAS